MPLPDFEGRLESAGQSREITSVYKGPGAGRPSVRGRSWLRPPGTEFLSGGALGI